MKFINFSIVKFSFFLTAGILVARFKPFIDFRYLLVPSFVVLLIFWTNSRKRIPQKIFFGIITYSCFLFLGATLYQYQTPSFQHQHYSKKISAHNLLQLKVKEVLKKDAYQFKYIVEVISNHNERSSGKLLLNIKRNSTTTVYAIDNLLVVNSKIEKIPSPLNPHQFDYSKYMKSLGIYHQINISNMKILNKSEGQATLRGQANKLRSFLISKLKQNNLSENELAIVQALVLGEKRDISKVLYDDYAAAGAIHILAVSGLHIGIIYMILLYIFNPIKRLFKSEKGVNILIIIMLWGFAFLTGLSPSVIRAVTMFSFFAFAKIINRDTNAINTLFLSYFTLLVINPNWLFHVGFQLSYLAVFFILWLVPIWNKFYYPKHLILKKFWGIITVTLAAQIGIIPLSLFYFHQFPGLFILTNLIVLPVIGLILCLGILLIFLSSFNALPDWFAFSYNYLIKLLNSIIVWIAGQDIFLFQDISFSFNQVIFSYLILITIVTYRKLKKHKIVLLTVLSLSILCYTNLLIKDYHSANELIIFHKTRHSLIGNKKGQKLEIFKYDSLKELGNNYPIKGYRIYYDINNYSEKKMPTVFNYKNKMILIVDSLGVYPKTIELTLPYS
jgi:competence protein ComEC